MPNKSILYSLTYNLFSWLSRVLNFIDVDCGPEGHCPDHVIKARSFQSFRMIFEAAWNKTLAKIRKNLDVSDIVDVKDFLVRSCGNKTWSNGKKLMQKILICKATFFFNILSNENQHKAEEIENVLIKNLFDKSLFKGLSESELNGLIVSKIESLVKNESLEMFDWDFRNVTATKMAAKLFFELSAITYRVTKLGTLMVWSDSYHLVEDFFKTLLGKMDNYVQAEVGPNDLTAALSPEFFNDLPKKEINRVGELDSNSKLCRDLPKHDQRSSCCLDSTTCLQGSIRTLMRVMREGMFHPHALEIDSRLENFTGNLSDGSYPRLPPSYLTEDLIGFKLIGPDSFKDQKKPHRHFLTPDPLIPFCKINDAWYYVKLCPD